MIRSIQASTLLSRWRRAKNAARVATGADSGTLVGLALRARTGFPQAASSSVSAMTASSISLSVRGVVFFREDPERPSFGR